MWQVVIPAVTGLVAGFFGGLVAWFTGTFLGRPISRFYDLRREAHATIYVSANISAQPLDRERADRSIADMRRMAFEIDALRATLPSVALGFLQRWRGYDLEKATKGLTGLSNSLFAGDGSKVAFRVTVQKALKLRLDPADEEWANSRRRTESYKL